LLQESLQLACNLMALVSDLVLFAGCVAFAKRWLLYVFCFQTMLGRLMCFQLVSCAPLVTLMLSS
jgi:hypothetical protein